MLLRGRKMVDWENIGNNLLTLGVLGGIGYLIYLKIKGDKPKLNFLKRFVGGNKNG